MAAKKRPGGARKGAGRRPLSSPALSAAVAEAQAGTATPEEAAERHGVASRTVRRRMANGSASAPAAGGAVAKVAPATTSLPQGGQVADRPDLLPLVRRILGKRNPAALAELDAGLVIATRGEPELAAWLELPVERGEAVDPLDALARALEAATTHVEKLPPLHPRAATMLGAVATLGTKLENVVKGRPRAETEDQLQARAAKVRAETLHILESTVAAEEAAAMRPREDAPRGVCITCERAL